MKKVAMVVGGISPLLLLLGLLFPIARVAELELIDLLLSLGILCGVGLVVARMLRALPRLDLQRRDDLAAEERERNARLSSLRDHAEQMEITLRDLRSLRLPRDAASRAEWAELDLEQALATTRAAMARERAGLFSVQAIRWLGQIEPLLGEVARLDAEGIRHWLGRLIAVRAQGVDIQTRLLADTEALAVPAGDAARQLLEEALGELDSLRADLLTRRARLLAHHAPGTLEPDLDDTVHSLREALSQARARREVQTWLSRG